MLGLIATALIVALASLVLGSGILAACGQPRPTWLAGGLGYAALLVLATLAIRLPGAATSTLIVLGLAVAIGAWRARGTARIAQPALEAALIAAVVLVMLSLPFLAAGHFGPLGVSLNDDLGFHVGWVESLRSGHPPVGLPPFAYPTAGESLAAPLAWFAGGGEQSLLGVTAAAPILTALAAMSLLGRAPQVLRLAGACAAGLPYLVGAYFGQGSLKEVQMGLMVLTFGALSARRPSRSAAAPLGVLSLGMFATFATAGLVWPTAILAARAVSTRDWRQGRATVPRWVGAGIWIALGAGVAALVYAGRSRFGTQAFGGGSFPDGNLVRPLPIIEGLGVWPGGDFRLPAHPEWAAVLLSGSTLAALVVALVLSVRQRVWLALVPAGACVGVYFVSTAAVTAYDSAKALVIAGPLIVLAILLPLGRAAIGPLTRARPLGAALAGLIVAGAVLGTTADALRNSPVDSPSLEQELEALRPQLIGHRVLFLGHDDWIRAELYGTDLFVPHPYAFNQESTPSRPAKGPQPPNDFDTVLTPVLAQMDYVITTRTTDASAPPASFSLIRSTAHYELWARRGPVTERDILAEGAAPGATFDCTNPVARRFTQQVGVAAVRNPPIVGSPWQAGPGAPAPLDATGLAFLAPGSHATSTIALPPGRWALSVDYQSPGAVTVQAGGARGVLPGRLEPVGARWDVATVTSDGSPLPLQVSAAARPAPAVHAGTLVGQVQAVPAGWSDVRSIPLSQACGRYVDWYRLGA